MKSGLILFNAFKKIMDRQEIAFVSLLQFDMEIVTEILHHVQGYAAARMFIILKLFGVIPEEPVVMKFSRQAKAEYISFL